MRSSVDDLYRKWIPDLLRLKASFDFHRLGWFILLESGNLRDFLLTFKDNIIVSRCYFLNRYEILEMAEES